MKIWRTWQDLPSDARNHAVALGNFDGVHRGHVHLLHQLHAARPDLPLAVLSFEPHPREFFRAEDPPFRLTLSDERAAALAALGVVTIYELPFDSELAHLTAEVFIEQVLVSGIGARHLACGTDFAFGHRRGGNVRFLESAASAHGIGLTPVPLLTDEDGPISSTRIRRLLLDGYPDRAAEELGRPFTIHGTVAHGDKRGRTLNFPTANVALGRHLEPARGVYAARVRLREGTVHEAVANLGRRPTVNSGPESRLEAHLFDFDADIYDQEIAVELHHYLREEQRFPSLDALKAQITRDAAQAREWLSVLAVQKRK